MPEKLVWDREGAIHAGGGRPIEEFAGTGIDAQLMPHKQARPASNRTKPPHLRGLLGVAGAGFEPATFGL